MTDDGHERRERPATAAPVISESYRPDRTTVPDAALAFAERTGLAVFPTRGKAPAISKDDGGNGFYDATNDPAAIEALFARAPYADGFGVVGATVFDLDVKPGIDGRDSAREAGLPYLDAETVRALTPRGGSHVYFAGTVPTRIGVLPGVDIKSAKAYVIAPPALGRVWEADASPWDVPLAPVPAWLRALAEGPPRDNVKPEDAPDDEDAPAGMLARAHAYVARIPGAVSGQNGHKATFTAALAAVRGFGLSTREGVEVLTRYNERCSPRWTQKELLHKVRTARADGRRPWRYLADQTPEQPRRPRPLTETGNAERLVDTFGADIRWNPAFGFLTYDGHRWERDDQKRVFSFAKDTVRNIYREAADADSEDERKALAKWAHKSESRAAREAMVALAASEPGIPVALTELDTDLWALNVHNGTLDLRTGQLRPHNRADLLTKLAGCPYIAGAKAPTWDRFLERVLPDPEVRAFVQRFAGYSATGSVREHAMLLFWGTGLNGKTTMTETWQHVLGDYSVTANPALLMAKGGDSHPTERATLHSRRLAVCSETEEGRALAEVTLKQLTGGDNVSARFMHRDEFTFAPTHKLVMSSNHKPRVRGTDNGVWRRIHLVPFIVTIPEEERDVELPEKLRAEAPGVLRWLVEGCLSWQRIGLRPPAAVRAATAEYRQDEDAIAQFLMDRCYVSPAKSDTVRVKAGDLYSTYRKWCEDTGTREQSQRSFGTALTERGFERTTRGAPTWYLGLRLLLDGDLGQDDSGTMAPSAPGSAISELCTLTRAVIPKSGAIGADGAGTVPEALR